MALPLLVTGWIVNNAFYAVGCAYRSTETALQGVGVAQSNNSVHVGSVGVVGNAMPLSVPSVANRLLN